MPLIPPEPGPGGRRRAISGLDDRCGEVDDAKPQARHPAEVVALERADEVDLVSRLRQRPLRRRARRRSRRTSRGPDASAARRCCSVAPTRRASASTMPVTARTGSTCPGPYGARRASSSASVQSRWRAGSTRSTTTRPGRSASAATSGGKRSGQCREGGREVRPRLGQEAESAGRRVPASLRQERGAGLERRCHMEVGRRPNRAANLVPDERRGRDRASEAVREAAGDEADEPRRPGIVADEQRARAALRGDEQAGRIARPPSSARGDARGPPRARRPAARHGSDPPRASG